MKLSRTQILALVVLAVAWLARSTPVAIPQPDKPVAADMVAFVYESDIGPLPAYVYGAGYELGVKVRYVDDDVTTGLGGQPLEIAKAIVAARAIGLPAMIVLGKGNVLSVQVLPDSKAAVLGAMP